MGRKQVQKPDRTDRTDSSDSRMLPLYKISADSDIDMRDPTTYGTPSPYSNISNAHVLPAPVPQVQPNPALAHDEQSTVISENSGSQESFPSSAQDRSLPRFTGYLLYSQLRLATRRSSRIQKPKKLRKTQAPSDPFRPQGRCDRAKSLRAIRTGPQPFAGHKNGR